MKMDKATVDRVVKVVTNHDNLEAAAKDSGSHFLSGLVAAMNALLDAASTPEVQSVHKRVLASLLGLTVLIYVAYRVIFFPIHLVLWWLSFVINTSRFSSILSQWSSTLIFLLPMVMSLLMRFVYYKHIEQCFFAVLKKKDPALAAELMKTPPISRGRGLTYHIKKLITVLMYLPVLTLVSMIPGVSFLMKFAWQVYTLNKHFDVKVAGFLAGVSLVPLVGVRVTWAVQAFLAQVFLFQELLYPYLCRAQMSKTQERQLITRNRAALVGFVSPLSFLLCMPYIGPLFIIMAHAAAPIFFIDFLHRPGQPALPPKGEEVITAKVD